MIALFWLLLMQDGAQVFLTEKEAVRTVFPEGEQVVRRDIELSPELLKEVRSRVRRCVENRYRLYVGHRKGRATGYAIVTEEVTRTLTMTFIVGVSLDGSVRDVVVMEHREKVGAEVARRRFLRQFRGKTLRDPLQRNRDMVHVVGATLSCDAAMRGTRKVLAVIRSLCLDRPENVRRILQESRAVIRRRYIMGTYCTITAYGPSSAVDKAFREIGRWDRILSHYDPQSELSRLNRSGSIDTSDDFIRFLQVCRKFADASFGSFDITVGALMKVWGFYDRKFRVPVASEVQEALRRVGRDRIRIDGSRVTLAKGTLLDPGGIGKGYAVDRAVAVLRQEGVKAALIDFGSTFYALGAPPGSPNWVVAIRDPFQNTRILGTVCLRDASISTSGNYEKFFRKDGKRYAHILDPREGRPIKGVASVSVVATTATASDALSTTLFVQGTRHAEGAGIPVLLIPSDPKEPVRATTPWRILFRPAKDR